MLSSPKQLDQRLNMHKHVGAEPLEMPQITIQFRETRTTKPSHNPQISEPPSNI
jgi:hypothetical protein